MSAYEIGTQEVEQRQAFLALGPADLAQLRKLHPLLHSAAQPFVDAFYDHLLQFEATRALIPDPATLARLKQHQACYFRQLTAGDYDLEYVRDRLRVGVAHQRVGLQTKWYLGAYAKYLDGMLALIGERLHDHPAEVLPSVRALLKVVLFDISLAVDAYLHADHQTLSALREYAEMVFAAIPDGLLVLSSNLTVLSANRSFLRRFGLLEHQVHGQPIQNVLAAEGLLERLAEVRRIRQPLYNLFFDLGRSSETERTPVRVTITGIRLAEEEEEEEEEEEARLLLVIEDLTEEARLQEALRDSEADLLRAQRVARIGSWRIDFADQQSLCWTPEVYRIFGVPSGTELSYGFFLERVHPDDREMLDAAWQAALHGSTYQVTHRILVHGETRWVEENALIERDPAGTPLRAIGTVQDITDRKLDAQRIERLAFYDPLTGLANRALFNDRLTQELATAERNSQRLALLYLDLDRFKEVNDTLGHSAGDQLLVEVAQRLRALLRQQETLARLGGDEFVVIAPDADLNAAVIAERIASALGDASKVTGLLKSFKLGASIGIAIYPEDGRTPELLLKHADIAMYRAKAAGGGFRFYRPQMGADLARRLDIVRRLDTALRGSSGLQLHYQPQFSLSSAQLSGAEALLRWQDPELGAVAPSVFIPIAEERGLISELGRWVLGQACRQARLWRDEGRALPGRVAVNVAAKQFDDDSFVTDILRIVADSGLPNQCVELELTESGVMHDPQRAIEVTRALSAAGLTLAIDDFGTGYSSLAYLKRFEAHRLKIDMSFVRDMLIDPHDRTIVKTIIAMGDSLGLETLAEGVEHGAQAQLLGRLACTHAQGYYFGRPVAADVFNANWLAPQARPA